VNWLDWLIIVIVVFSSFLGLRRGLLASLAGLAGTLVGLFVAYTYYRPLAEYLTANWHIEEKIKPLVLQLFKLWTPSRDSLQSVSQPFNPASIVGDAGILANAGDYLANSFTGMLLDVFCFLALWLITTWAINLAGSVLTRIAQLSMLGAPNRLGGLLFGTIRGLAIVIIILALLAPFQGFSSPPGREPGDPGANLRRSSAFEDSVLLPYFEPFFDAIGRPLPTGTTVLR